MNVLKRPRHPLASAITIALITSGCGGGGEGSVSTPPPVVVTPVVPPTIVAASADTTFPTGLAVGSPADLSATIAVADVTPAARSLRYAADFGRALWSAIKNEDGVQLASLAAKSVPISSAYAAATKSPDLADDIVLVEKVLAGDPTVGLGVVLNFDKLFSTSTNANCYGPSMKYDTHEDALSGPGTLPGGDLGIWLEYEGAQPCVAAQLSKRVRGVKAQTLQGLLMMAAMRRSVTSSTSLTMPAAGASTDLTTEFEAMLRGHAPFAAFDVGVASISRDVTGNIYTYRLTLDNGLPGAAAKSGEVIMTHTPGATSAAYSGVMQVSAFSLSSDLPLACSDVIDSASGMYQTANVGTLKYHRDGTSVSFNHRSGIYCGHPASFAAAAFGAAVATYTSDGQLDPAIAVTGGVRGSTKGWRASFSRFAGDFKRDHLDGDFRYAWQAGPQDGHSRMLALDTTFNTVTEMRTLKGYFAYGADIKSTNDDMLGMICNWAGPGNSHATALSFQSQTAELTATGAEFVIPSGGSKITFAPTKSCNSLTTQFDVNVNGTVAPGEGVPTTNNLDVPTALTVETEIQARGFVSPTLY
jgi:hypothetical protein